MVCPPCIITNVTPGKWLGHTGLMIKILAIAGSLRQDSNSKAILKTLCERKWHGATVEAFDLGGIPLYNGDLDGDEKPGQVPSFKEAISRSDGLLIITPEYNYGMSGVLKNALDWASRPAMDSVLKDKPCVVIASSPAGTGGVRAHEQVRKTLYACLSHVVPAPEVAIPKVHEKLEDGRLTDFDSLKMAAQAVDALIAWVGAHSREPANR